MTVDDRGQQGPIVIEGWLSFDRRDAGKCLETGGVRAVMPGFLALRWLLVPVMVLREHSFSTESQVMVRRSQHRVGGPKASCGEMLDELEVLDLDPDHRGPTQGAAAWSA